MSETEFDIIRRYFQRQKTRRSDVITGIGDDAAVLHPPTGSELVVCMDTLVAGVHFPQDTAAAAIGHKVLAVNLSDLAAMGADPLWATLSVTLPDNDAAWLEGFSRGFFQLADRHDVQLVGGDTTRGPLSVTVQVHGSVPRGRAIHRSGAQVGDRIYVTGSLGDAGLALRMDEQVDDRLRQRLDFPEPQLAAGQALRAHASAAIDISDGLLADLGHLLAAEQRGASIRIDDLPRSVAFNEVIHQSEGTHPEWLYDLPLSAGDDYELCFTVPGQACEAAEHALAAVSVEATVIGVIEATAGIRCVNAAGEPYQSTTTGYQHFGETT
jgi:thiamine-monophosphate kinase